MMFEVERVLQSHEDFSLDGSVHINLIHVAIPSGGKRRDYRPRFINLEERLKKKIVLSGFGIEMNCAVLEPL